MLDYIKSSETVSAFKSKIKKNGSLFYINYLKDPHIYQLTLFGETTEFHE